MIRIALTAVGTASLALLLGCGAETEATVDRAPLAQNDDLAQLGSSDGILFWTPEEQVAGYRNTEHLFPTRVIAAGDAPLELRDDPQDFSTVSYEVEGETFTVDQYVQERRTAGLLVVKGDRVLLERYTLGNDENSRWISFSIAKSVVSMLIGAAIQDGYIGSVDEPVTRYLPQLAGGGYDDVSIEDVLHMASGVAWNEDYADPESDVASTPPGNLALLRYMKERPSEHEPGEVFNYNTGETNLAGALLRAAIGNNLATYLSAKIWRPFGMEADATWMLHEPDGGELGGCCISATLRDYARIGMFALRDGIVGDGSRALPEGWMAASTSPSDGFDGYGYLWWLRGDGDFAGLGIFGQLLYMDPESEIVIVTHSAWPTAVGRELSEHRWALVAALAEAARESP